uniref:Uncharacterized protein n=1 Tax=Avena sativa TaxID=4498 RepID=A0ACD6A8E1_AVESA
MEVKLVVTLVAWMLFCISNRECALSDLKVTQTTVPGQRGRYALYLVTVENKCICTQTDVKLACAGFDSSSIPVNPAGIITSDGDDSDLCTLNGGYPVTNDAMIKFYYAWSTEFSFAPVSSNISCSVA